MESRRAARALIACLGLLPILGSATEVEALFDLSDWRRAPFPSDRFSTLDFDNLTFRRVQLPFPNCAERVTDCNEVAVLNTLDGFNLQPRLRIPFSGPIDPSSVNSESVYLIKLGDTTELLEGFGERIGVNQIVWDPATNTLAAESDELLDQHSVYVLIVTTNVRDASGARLRPARLLRPTRHDADDALYRASLLTALLAVKAPLGKVAAASVFTTRSTTAVLEKIRDQIKASMPAPADFAIVNDGSRAVFSMQSRPNFFATQETAPGVFGPARLVPASAIDSFIPGAVGTFAFGRFTSPHYLTSGRYLPVVPTRTGVPRSLGEETVYFNLVLPAGPRPPNGWPVAIFGHGLPGDKDVPMLSLSATLASRGIALLTINAVGNGGGPQGTIRVMRSPPLLPVTLPSGGRAIDPASLNTYEATRDVNAVAPYNSVSYTDSIRQTAVDLMQLVRVIETNGIDHDEDGIGDLDPQRIYYFGHSWGAIYGPVFVAVEPSIRAAVFNSGGGPAGISAQLSPISRQIASISLGSRVPSLLNALPAVPPAWGFNSNTPLRNQPPVINDVAGAIAIQEASEIGEWVQQSGAPVAHAAHLRKRPLTGLAPKSVLVQFGLGDLNVPNPVTTNFIRGGELADVTTYLRTDLAVALNSSLPKNPHGFLNAAFPTTSVLSPYGRGLQDQIATFFGSDGVLIVDPDGAAPIFETPIAGPLPEEVNFLP